MTSASSGSASPPRLRLGFFGAFYPTFDLAGNSSTGLVLALRGIPEVEGIRVFCPETSRMPPGIDEHKVTFDRCWVPDSPISLIATFLTMFAARREFDSFLFNMYVTSFGRKRVANIAGMLLPPLLAYATSKRVFVYMHNFAVTQDVSKLGYSPTLPTKWGVSLLERFLLKFTNVIVPLKGQARVLQAKYHAHVTVLPLTFVDALAAANVFERAGSPAGRSIRSGPIRLLLFGSWGPQKDLTGILRKLQAIKRDGTDLEVTIAGGFNVHFPKSAALLQDLRREYANEPFHFVGTVAEEDLIALFLTHDVLLIPYHAAGGYSGAVNCAALTGLPVVAYDLPEFREQAGWRVQSIEFVSPGTSPADLLSAIRNALGKGSDAEERRAAIPRNIAVAMATGRALLSLMQDPLDAVTQIPQTG